jgi:hypothetical protein
MLTLNNLTVYDGKFLAKRNWENGVHNAEFVTVAIKHPDIVGRDYFAGLRVTQRNKATVLLTLTLLQTPTLILT